MTVEEGVDFFKAVPAIRDKLQTLKRVGLGYIQLGQPATTLSGGEAQRVKLSKELSRRADGAHPLHPGRAHHRPAFRGCAQAARGAARAGRSGNTVVVIEHNLDVIKTADWIIDLGPEGGDKGGRDRGPGHPGRGRRSGRQLHRPVPRALSAQPHPSEGAEPGVSRPLIIDTDPGIDDALAILLACASPELELRALTTVAGNVPLARVTENALKLLELGGKPKVPVYPGADAPLGRKPTVAQVHGTSGMDGADLPPPRRSQSQATLSTISSKPSLPPRRGA